MRERNLFGELTKLAADWQLFFFFWNIALFMKEVMRKLVSFSFFFLILFLVASDNSSLSERAQETRSAEEDTIRPNAP